MVTAMILNYISAMPAFGLCPCEIIDKGITTKILYMKKLLSTRFILAPCPLSAYAISLIIPSVSYFTIFLCLLLCLEQTDNEKYVGFFFQMLS